jgi:endo-1,3-1,4-beta-glycanase ExoK
MKHIALVAMLLQVVAPTSRSESFQENFSEGLNPERWMISTWTAPHNTAENHARFHEGYVEVIDGILRLKLTQYQNPDGSITSIGSELRTVASFGFGDYTMRMKASSDSSIPSVDGKPVSGSISGVFVFKDKSETEIDIEVEGNRPSLTQTSTWVDESEPETKKISAARNGKLPQQGFHDYKFSWLPGVVKFYRDGILISTHTHVVPSSPAQFMFNHWGTNSEKWGGLATPGVDRYMFVESFTFTPLEDLQPARSAKPAYTSHSG